MRSLLLVALALAPIHTAQARAQESGFDVALFRTRRGPELTVVDGVLEFDPRRVEGGTGCGYVVALSVTDSSGVVLLRDSWRGVLACEEAEEDARSAGLRRLVVETFQFAVMPGQYSLELSLQPDGKPDEALRLRRDIDSLTETAVASDLILAREVGWVDTTEASRWTVQ
ncbi:MAG: hypothetical protein GTO05_02565, partial [Gemmatimonadales bacterium]|nr:hypothetical protein [Gemmatimonadales bacterium]